MEGHRMTRPIAALLRWVALIGTLGGIATLEYLAGQAAGWSDLRSAGVPLGIDAFVMSVLLADRARWYDRAAALGLMEFTVVVSAVAGHHDKVNGRDPNVALGAVLATALVFALWRVDETFRAERHHTDALAALNAELGQMRDMLKRVGTEREQAIEEAVTATVAEQTALREQAVREAVASARAKTQRRREEPPPERPATDAELADVIAATLAASPKAGRGTVVAELKARGLTPGKGERLADALAAHKRGAIHAVPTSAAL
jgi:hypothetical protein